MSDMRASQEKSKSELLSQQQQIINSYETKLGAIRSESQKAMQELESRLNRALDEKDQKVKSQKEDMERLREKHSALQLEKQDADA